MSEYLTGAESRNTERSAEGLTLGNEDSKSAVESSGFELEAAGSAAWAVIQRLMAIVPASRTTALRSAPTYPCALNATVRRSASDSEWGVLDSMTFKMVNLASASGTPRNEKKKETVGACQRCGPEADLPISISRSKRPGRLRAGSIEFGRFVVATTTTRPASGESPCMPSINVSSVATTRFSTSPPGPSSRLGHKASTSSRTMIHGLLAWASEKTALNLDSVSPW